MIFFRVGEILRLNFSVPRRGMHRHDHGGMQETNTGKDLPYGVQVLVKSDWIDTVTVNYWGRDVLLYKRRLPEHLIERIA
jgi:hypothetical protein